MLTLFWQAIANEIDVAKGLSVSNMCEVLAVRVLGKWSQMVLAGHANPGEIAIEMPLYMAICWDSQGYQAQQCALQVAHRRSN